MGGRSLLFLTRILRRSGHVAAFNRKLNPVRIPNSLLACRFCTELSIGSNVSQSLQPTDVPDDTLRKKRIGEVKEPRGNLYDFVERSPILQQLIDLGVEIYKFNHDRSLCKFLMNLDFEDNIKPYLIFLYEKGVPEEKFGEFLTKNPYILKCDLDDLQVRINYLKSKNFTNEMITQIITQNPKWLSYNVKHIDRVLGDVQTALELTGDEVRSLACMFPGIVSVRSDVLRLNMFTFKEEFGVNMRECKSLILKEPRLLKSDNASLIKTLHYLIYNMCVPIHLIIEQPKVLFCRAHILHMRHTFLHCLGRAQYNPNLPGFISLNDLVTTNDEEFCQRIARTSITNFYNFQKTL